MTICLSRIVRFQNRRVEMNKWVAGLGALMFSSVVYAQCVTNTYNINGRITVCTTCCYGGSCSTTCF